MSDEVVKLTEVASEPEAAMLCGYLESHGVRAAYDPLGSLIPETPLQAIAGTGSGAGAAFVGRQEILVRAEDTKEALRLLTLLPK